MLAEGFVENGAKVYIIGRREEVLDRTVNEVTQQYGSGGGSIHA
jgi:short-subunit dehydrogenase